MADYRLYFLDPDGHVARSIELQLETDDDALREVSGHPHAYGMELWQLGRCVRTFRPSSSEGAYVRPTTLERAYQLASSGACPTVADIKVQLRREGFAENHIVGPVLVADLRRLCAEVRKASLGQRPSDVPDLHG